METNKLFISIIFFSSFFAASLHSQATKEPCKPSEFEKKSLLISLKEQLESKDSDITINIHNHNDNNNSTIADTNTQVSAETKIFSAQDMHDSNEKAPAQAYPYYKIACKVAFTGALLLATCTTPVGVGVAMPIACSTIIQPTTLLGIGLVQKLLIGDCVISIANIHEHAQASVVKN